MKEYIERENAEKVFSNARKHMKPENYTGQEFFIRDNILLNAEQIVHAIPAADVVEVDAVFEMLDYTLGDCPCNYSPTDEWLPEVCELQDECPDPKEKYGCWRQFIKHFRSRKMDGGVNDAVD